MSLEDSSQVPLLPNPDGSPPNFVNPPSLKAATFAVSLVLMFAAFILVPLRFRTNLKLYKKLKVDDYCCGVAWLLATAYGAIVMTSTPTARHIWDVPLSAVNASWVKRSAVLGTIYGPAMWFAKTAILTLYLRLFSVIRWMRWCCYIGIGICFIAYWSLVPVSVVYNFPHGDEQWDLATTEASKPAQVPFVIMGLVSVIADVYILVLPFPILLRLQVSWKQRVGWCLVFITALIGIVCSILVFYFRVVLWRNETLDSTWNVAASYLTVVVELNVAVLVSCAPAAVSSWRHLLRDSKVISSIRSVLRSTRSSKNLVQITSNQESDRAPKKPSASVSNLASLPSIELGCRR